MRQRRRQIGQRPDRANDDLARRGGTAFAQIACRAPRVGGAVRGRGRQAAEPFRSMDEIRRRFRGAAQRHRRAAGDGRRMSGHLGKMEGVASRSCGRDIAEDCCQADHLQTRVGKGLMNGHGIINPGIGVDDDFLRCGIRHRYYPPDAGQCDVRNSSTAARVGMAAAAPGLVTCNAAAALARRSDDSMLSPAAIPARR